MSYQQITIVGNVGRDAELAYTPQGIAVSKFTVAVNKVTGKGETKQEKTIWFKVSMWREKAENLTQYVKKGGQIMVVGEIDLSVYTNKDGQPAGSLELNANSVQLLGGNRSGTNKSAASEEPPMDNQTEGSTTDQVGDIPF